MSSPLVAQHAEHAEARQRITQCRGKVGFFEEHQCVRSPSSQGVVTEPIVVRSGST